MARQKKEVQEEKVLQPEDVLKGVLEETEGEHFQGIEEINYKISTGSLKLDIELGGGLGPGFHRKCGHNSSGKTASLLEEMANFVKSAPKRRGFLARAEGRLSEENKARVGVPFVTSVEDWKDGTIFVFNCNKYTPIAKAITNLIRNNPSGTLYCFGIDSMDALKVKDDEGKNLDENAKVAGTPLLSKRFLSDINLEATIKGHMGYLVSQVAADIKLDPYAKTAPKDGNFSGGNALAHFANFTLEYHKWYQSDLILDPPSGKPNDGKTKIVGHWAKVTIRKSDNEKNYVTVQYPIKHGVKGRSAVWVEYEVVDLLLQWELASQKGAWIKVSEDLIKELAEKSLEMKEQLQGLDNFRTYLEENPAITEYLIAKFKSLLSK